MRMDAGGAMMAVALSTLAAGPAFFLGLLLRGLIELIQSGGGGGFAWEGALMVLWGLAWMTLLGLFVAALPNAVMVFGLGLLGKSQAWARSYIVWILAGLALGLLIAWRLSETSLILSWEIVFAGGACGLVARRFMRWTAEPAAAPVEVPVAAD